MSLVDKKCECCKKDIKVRKADVKRGWGRFCSKSCKAKNQTSKRSFHYDNREDCGHPLADGYFGHGQS